ncbi:MAG: hypothetical protein KGJ93_05155 [Patescibacteria group bacterium]|nr:hypothetical protein [Patescibacteria group bacterium]
MAEKGEPSDLPKQEPSDEEIKAALDDILAEANLYLYAIIRDALIKRGATKERLEKLEADFKQYTDLVSGGYRPADIKALLPDNLFVQLGGEVVRQIAKREGFGPNPSKDQIESKIKELEPDLKQRAKDLSNKGRKN